MENEVKDELKEEIKEELKQEFNQQNNKKSKGLIIVIIILGLVVLGLIGYIAYDKLSEKDSNPKTKEENKKDIKEVVKDTARELTDDEKNRFEDIITKINQYFSKYYPVTNPQTIIANDELLTFALVRIGYSNESFTGDEVVKIIKTYFGNSVSVTNKDIICAIDNEPFYTYNATTNMYKKSSYSHGHDGIGFMDSKYFFESGSVKDDKEFTINAKVLYAGYRSGTWGPTSEYFGSYEDAKKGTNALYKSDNEDEDINLTDDLYQSIKDKFPTTTYKFEKNSEGYYDLLSITVK